jgi:hypothetical protein
VCHSQYDVLTEEEQTALTSTRTKIEAQKSGKVSKHKLHFTENLDEG